VWEANEAIAEALAQGSKRDSSSFAYWVSEIEKGAMRTIAARLLEQPLQVAAGHRDLFNAFMSLEQRREENRQKQLAERRLNAPKRKAPAKPRTLPAKKAAKPVKQEAEEPQGKLSTVEAMRRRAGALRDE
jgi:hypothetical protein